MQPNNEFRPLLGLSNAHVQTLMSVFCKSRAFPYRIVRRRVRLDDGDQLVIHDSSPDSWRPGDPIAFIVHGLTGNHRSSSIVAVARLLARRGIRNVRIDLRGTGFGLYLAKKSYHAGCSEDVRAAIDFITKREPRSPVWLVGVSLGANVSLKLAGEASDRPVNNLVKVAVIAPPLDLSACIDLLEKPSNRFYEKRFLAELLAEMHLRRRVFPELFNPSLFKPTRIREFDDLYTAPQAGFRDSAEYYARSSSKQFVPKIRIPALVLAASDDPFIDMKPLYEIDLPKNVEVWITQRGGHVGFMGRHTLGSICWAEQAITNWLVNSCK